MRRLFAPLIAGAIIASMALAGPAIASASTSHGVTPLNAGSMARTYMNRVMIDYTHMSPAAMAGARAAGCSYRSIAASAGVDATQIVTTASARAQSVVNARVRKHLMTRSRARTFMATFRAYCIRYLGTLPISPDGSLPTTGTPGMGYPGSGMWGVVPTSTPSVPTTFVPGPGMGHPGSGMWGVVPTATPSVPSTLTPSPGSGPGMCW